MKPTSIFVAVGLAFCQLAAAAPKPESVNSISVQWWNQTNFTGASDTGDAMPGECYGIEDPFRGTIQSLQVDSDSTCNFFTTLALVYYPSSLTERGWVIFRSFTPTISTATSVRINQDKNRY
ncbi:hypothetical protein PILCRDRAFT_821 [Piloderma croceum F 1598]|uniref:Uncharacterized protein n=1 Tax=Piloderma croceum (strain F 1598) TaxID=765440 RepID=A0A0C3GJ96_PILCF|nr:hypothetical protein PILCRDRAFT_821 [Piloderma croceum F 1598]